jgi:aminomethyltransferase
MKQIGCKFPTVIRQTALTQVEEEWYIPTLAAKLGREITPVKRSNFGEYEMAVHYLTSVLEEAKAVEKVAIYNIDHMAQIRFTGKDALALLDRVLPANVASMKIGQCKYTLLLNEQGGVQDDLIIMRVGDAEFILVINAGHDITDVIDGKEYISDADRIMKYLQEGEEVIAKDISDELVKIDIQGPYSFKLIKSLYGEGVLKNRTNPEKNMNFFSFNEFDFEGEHYLLSRTGYTNRWGWELYVPVAVAAMQFKKIVTLALEMGGLLVGLGGRDENRLSAGNVGLPLMGQEYDPDHTPTNAPLFNAAFDLEKEFVGKAAIMNDLNSKSDKRMVLIISEGIVSHRGIYKDGKRLGSVTSSINSPNLSQEKREFLNSSRKTVNGEDGVAAIGLGWLYHNPYEVDAEGNDVIAVNDSAVRISIELYKEDEAGNPSGKPVLGYICADGVTPATAPKALKNIEKL